MVEILLKTGPSIPNVNLTNGDKETALHCAAQYGHLEVSIAWHTVCTRSLNPFYEATCTYYVNWVNWKYCTILNEGIIMVCSVIYLLFR